jgi:pyridoxal phosphate enzyme (YggS family)
MTVTENVARARERIAAACLQAGRDPASVRVCAVSKTFPPETIRAAVEAGVDAIGENRVQEAAAKRPAFGPRPPWHLVGPLQRNKARQALELFDLLQSLDRPELADRLEKLLAGSGRSLPVFLEVNVGGEAQKHGVDVRGAPALLDHVLERCPSLRPLGLMTVPPYDPDPERSRPCFAELRLLAEELWARRALGAPELSMGMSEDFEVGVEEGATWVRLGRALFGPRPSGA